MGKVNTLPLGGVTMGGGSSTVLDCMLRNFDWFRGQDPGMDVGQLETFCTSEWPAFGVGWPPEGTLNLGIIWAVHLVVSGRPGHPDQFIYMGHRQESAQDMAGWLPQCARRTSRAVRTTGSQRRAGRTCCSWSPRVKTSAQVPVAQALWPPIFLRGNPFCNNLS